MVQACLIARFDLESGHPRSMQPSPGQALLSLSVSVAGKRLVGLFQITHGFSAPPYWFLIFFSLPTVKDLPSPQQDVQKTLGHYVLLISSYFS